MSYSKIKKKRKGKGGDSGIIENSIAPEYRQWKVGDKRFFVDLADKDSITELKWKKHFADMKHYCASRPTDSDLIDLAQKYFNRFMKGKKKMILAYHDSENSKPKIIGFSVFHIKNDKRVWIGLSDDVINVLRQVGQKPKGWATLYEELAKHKWLPGEGAYTFVDTAIFIVQSEIDAVMNMEEEEEYDEEEEANKRIESYHNELKYLIVDDRDRILRKIGEIVEFLVEFANTHKDDLDTYEPDIEFENGEPVTKPLFVTKVDLICADGKWKGNFVSDGIFAYLQEHTRIAGNIGNYADARIDLVSDWQRLDFYIGKGFEQRRMKPSWKDPKQYFISPNLVGDGRLRLFKRSKDVVEEGAADEDPKKKPRKPPIQSEFSQEYKRTGPTSWQLDGHIFNIGSTLIRDLDEPTKSLLEGFCHMSETQGIAKRYLNHQSYKKYPVALVFADTEKVVPMAFAVYDITNMSYDEDSEDVYVVCRLHLMCANYEWREYKVDTNLLSYLKASALGHGRENDRRPREVYIEIDPATPKEKDVYMNYYGFIENKTRFPGLELTSYNLMEEDKNHRMNFETNIGMPGVALIGPPDRRGRQRTKKVISMGSVDGLKTWKSNGTTFGLEQVDGGSVTEDMVDILEAFCDSDDEKQLFEYAQERLLMAREGDFDILIARATSLPDRDMIGFVLFYTMNENEETFSCVIDLVCGDSNWSGYDFLRMVLRYLQATTIGSANASGASKAFIRLESVGSKVGVYKRYGFVKRFPDELGDENYTSKDLLVPGNRLQLEKTE